MILSMTGFGRATRAYGQKRFTAEVKSLNSKQLDLSARIPSAYREKEVEIRSMIANKMIRGKVDFILTIENTSAETSAKVNTAVIGEYKRQIQEACQTIGIAEPQDWMPMLIRMPEAMESEVTELDEAEWLVVKETVDASLDAIVNFRKTEGESLKRVFEKNVGAISDILCTVDPYEKERVEIIKARLRETIETLGTDYDKNRFEQEMIFYIEKLDINEEKNRLRQHIKYFIETMNSEDCSVGKKLGFIAQEMGREINTMGSKSNHAMLQKIVVEMKDELEQIKEQVLNAL